MTCSKRNADTDRPPDPCLVDQACALFCDDDAHLPLRLSPQLARRAHEWAEKSDVGWADTEDAAQVDEIDGSS